MVRFSRKMVSYTERKNTTKKDNSELDVLGYFQAILLVKSWLKKSNARKMVGKALIKIFSWPLMLCRTLTNGELLPMVS